MTKRFDPMGTLPMFDTATTPEGRVVAAGRFRCGLCNTMGVDEAGELCPGCAERVLTTKPKTPRRPRRQAPGKPRAPRKSVAG